MVCRPRRLFLRDPPDGRLSAGRTRPWRPPSTSPGPTPGSPPSTDATGSGSDCTDAIAVGTLDVFLDEDLDYARRLIEAGVPTELHVYPGLFHGSDLFVPDAASSARFIADRDAALSRALHPEPSPLPD